jgi:hypothetical protein
VVVVKNAVELLVGVIVLKAAALQAAEWAAEAVATEEEIKNAIVWQSCWSLSKHGA